MRIKRNRKTILIAVIIIFSLFAIWSFAHRIDTDFATEITICSYEKEVKVTDPNDVAELIKICSGFTHKEMPSCGFDINKSILFSDGEKSIALCPALDGDAYLRVGNTDRYIWISESDRARLNTFGGKYGVGFHL